MKKKKEERKEKKRTKKKMQKQTKKKKKEYKQCNCWYTFIPLGHLVPTKQFLQEDSLLLSLHLLIFRPL